MGIQTEQSMVSRTFRAAIRIGEDFYTVEETVTLPLDAGDDQIAQAVNTGMRIYEAQRALAEKQIRELRDQVVTSPLPIQIRDPESPASDKQRAYMDYLINELGWDTDRLHTFAVEHHLDLLKMTKGEASELIDSLKRLLEARNDDGQPAPDEAAAEPEPVVADEPAKRGAERQVREVSQGVLPVGDLATTRQVKALERLGEERGLDVEGELQARFGGRPLAELTIDEAGQLLTEWQQRPRTNRVLRRAA